MNKGDNISMSDITNSKDSDKAPEQKFRMRIVEIRLSQLSELIPATFNREITNSHVAKIEQAIVSGNMLNNVISIWDGKVIDGQHRLKAYQQIYEKTGVDETIPMCIREIFARDEDEARELMRCLNKGKRLDLSDFLKTWDNGTYSFYNLLRKHCTHKKTKRSITYHNAYSWIIESKIQNEQVGNLSGGISAVLTNLPKITNDECIYARKFIDALLSLEDQGLLKKTHLIRYVYAVSVKMDLDPEHLFTKLHKVAKSDELAKFLGKYGFTKSFRPHLITVITSELS